MVRLLAVGSGIVFLLGNIVPAALAETPLETVTGQKVEVVITKREGLAFRAECVKTAEGATVGFRVEMINTDPLRSVVCSLRRNVETHFCPRVFVELALVSPLLPKEDYKAKEDNYQVIPPHSSHAWFVAFPPLLLADTGNVAEGGSTRRPEKGVYSVVIGVNVAYSKADSPRMHAGIPSQTERLSLMMPPLYCQIDPEKLGGDVLASYIAWQYRLVLKHEEAIASARRELGKMLLAFPNARADVKIDQDGMYVVTFTEPPRDPPVPGPEFIIRVWVDGRTGKVIRSLGG